MLTNDERLTETLISSLALTRVEIVPTSHQECPLLLQQHGWKTANGFTLKTLKSYIDQWSVLTLSLIEIVPTSRPKYPVVSCLQC